MGTFHRPQVLELLARLDPFRNHVHAQSLPQHHNGFDDGSAFAILDQLRNKRLVNLQRVNRKVHQISKRRVSRSKIVNPQFNPRIL